MDSHLASYLSEMKYEKDSDDVSKRRFDRDRDIASHRIKADDKKKMVEAAKNLDSGFKRSYL